MPIEELDEKADTAFKIRSFFFPLATIPETYSPRHSLALICFPLEINHFLIKYREERQRGQGI
ncbi:hypothetical protein BVL54_09990 [Bacillus paralicheniformis]|nr:hypothetical protein BVL54_09990 [Bacillus paralicheniformis]